MNQESRSAQSSSGLSLSLDFCNDTPSRLTLPDMASRGSLAGGSSKAYSPSWLEVGSIVPSETFDQFSENTEDARNSSPYISNVVSHHDFEMFANSIMSSQSPKPDNANTTMDGMEKDIRELTELSIAAYRVMMIPQATLKDELIAMTQSVLDVLARVTENVKQLQQDSPVTPSGLYPGSFAAVSLALQIVSVCEQIYNAFLHACLVLHHELKPAARFGNGIKADNRSTVNAQAVLTVELINYLFEKLIRGQKKLLVTTLTADDDSTDSPGTLSLDGSATSSLPSSDSSSCNSMRVIPIMNLRANGKHPELQAHIQAVRDLAMQNDHV